MMTHERHSSAAAPLRTSTLVELLRCRARHQPTQRAYTFLADGEVEEVSLTYAELDRQARAIGASLQSLGAASERALLLYPPGLEYIAAFFGCLYAGVTAVPVYPPRQRTLPRLLGIVQDAQAKVALTTAALHSTVTLFGHSPALRQIHWFLTEGSSNGREERWHMPAITGDSLAFLQYTSGSTGTPKGVMLSHAHLMHNQHLIQQAMGHTEQSVVLGWLPLYHDMGLIGNVFQPLYVGIPCILMSPLHFLQQPWRWLQAITRYQATTSGGPNFAYDLCVRKITAEQGATLDLRSWRVAFNGAEPIRAATLERFTAAFAPYGFRPEAFYPCYGLAEATLLASGGDRNARAVVRTFAGSALEQHRVAEVHTAEQGTRTLVGCGRSLGEQRLIIVDPESRQRCPAGQVGEIWLQGPSVARGYWNRPEESASTFQARLADTDAGPFLCTGDLGFLQDDELFVTGRCKDLLIIHGRNHYPQDIECTVQQTHAALRPGCGAAFAMEGSDTERLIVVQEVESHQPDLEAVALAIRQAVVHEHEVQVDTLVLIEPGSLPKTSSGKIQRHACRTRFLDGSLQVVGEWRHDTARQPEPYVAPRTAVEKIVAGIWAQVCGIDLVGRHANFFTLGGDSLLGAQILARVREALQVQLSPHSLFDNPTVAGFCAHIEHARLAAPSLAAAPLSPGVRDTDLPLAFAQQRLWFLDQLASGLPVFHIALAVRLQGTLHEDGLSQSLAHILQRHETLRTTFPVVHGQPGQRIAAVIHVPLPMIDLQAIPAAAREAQVWQLASAEARRPFDLRHQVGLRTTLVRLGNTEHFLLLTLHHIVADFWSIRLFMRELVTLYTASVAGKPSPLPALIVQYADFAHWQHQWLQSAASITQLAYWRQQLSGAPAVLALPTARPRSTVQTFCGTTQSFVLPTALTRALETLSRQHEVTLFVTLLAAFKILLHHYTGQSNDVVVGSPITGRTQVEVEGLIGYFLNTLALRTDLAGDPSFSALLQRVLRVVLEAQAHQDLPFEKVVEALRPERSSHHTPVFQVVFNFQNIPLPALQLPGLTLTPHELDTGTVKHDLTLYMRHQADGLQGTFAYNTDLFETTTITAMQEDWLTLLHGIVAQPDARLSQLGNLLRQAYQQAHVHQQHAVHNANRASLGRVPRQALHVSSAQLVRIEPLQPGVALPLLVQPTLDEVDLIAWLGSNRQMIRTALLKHGALLFRGFHIASAALFTQVALAVTPQLLDYIEGASPRLAVGDRVYTSTEYPAAYAIAMHNELSYRSTWPEKLFFCCLEAPQQGGETPLADSRQVYTLLAADILERFRHRGVQYVRNFHGGQGSGQSWQTAFATWEKTVVEAYCSAEGMRWRWKADGGLWCSQVRPAWMTHPQTGEPVWFNQAHQWHLSNLEPELALALGSTVSADELPMNAYYGDGTPLELSVLTAIRAAYRQATITFPWRAGDVLLLDNMLMAHGRMPFVGPRTVLVAMGDSVRLSAAPHSAAASGTETLYVRHSERA